MLKKYSHIFLLHALSLLCIKYKLHVDYIYKKPITIGYKYNIHIQLYH